MWYKNDGFGQSSNTSQDNMQWQSNDIFPSVVLSRLASAQLDVKHFDFTDIAL